MSANKTGFTSYCPTCMAYISFSSLGALDRTFSIISNRIVRANILALFLILESI